MVVKGVVFRDIQPPEKCDWCTLCPGITLETHACVCVCEHLLTPCSVFVVSKESAGAVDEEDFIKSFTDVPTVQVH